MYSQGAVRDEKETLKKSCQCQKRKGHNEKRNKKRKLEREKKDLIEKEKQKQKGRRETYDSSAVLFCLFLSKDHNKHTA